MRLSVIFVSLVATLLTLGGVAQSARAERHANAMQQLQAGVLAELNSTRQQRGLAPLRMSTSLGAAARQHSSEMATRGYFSHTSANGTTFDRRIARYYP